MREPPSKGPALRKRRELSAVPHRGASEERGFDDAKKFLAGIRRQLVTVVKIVGALM